MKAQLVPVFARAGQVDPDPLEFAELGRAFHRSFSRLIGRGEAGLDSILSGG